MRVVEKTKSGISSLAAKQVKPSQIKAVGSKLASQILKVLAKKPTYPMAIAKKLKVNEQKVYYHIRKLEAARLIEAIRQDVVHGTMANVYAPTAPAFVLTLTDLEETHFTPGLKADPVEFLAPIIENGELNAVIVVGSPDPHGPEMARSRDGYYGIDLALFLGTFLNNIKGLTVRLDTEVRSEDLKENLVVIGGPVVNTVTAKLNKHLPINFDQKQGWAIKSSVTDKVYHEGECGIITKQKNPFNKRKWVLVVAGKGYAGTQAVTIAFLNHFNELVKGNKFDTNIPARVVEGLDRNADGVVDDIRFVE